MTQPPCPMPLRFNRLQPGKARIFNVLLVFASLLLMAGVSSAADIVYPELDVLYRDVIRLRREIMDERGRLAVQQLERTLLEEQLPGTKVPATETASPLVPIVREHWIRSADKRREAIDKYAADRRAVLDKMVIDWEIVQLSSLRFREHLRRIESQLGVDAGASRAFSWIFLALWLAPSAGLLLTASVFLRWHENRIAIRRALRATSFARPNVSSASLLLFAALLFGAGGCNSASELTSAKSWLAGQVKQLTEVRSELESTLQKVQAEVATLTKQNQTLRTQVHLRLQKVLGSSEATGSSGVARALITREDESLSKLENALSSVALLPLYEGDATKLVAELKKQQEDLKLFVDRHQARTIWISTVALGTSGVIALIAAIPFLAARRATAVRRQRNRNTCPRCLATGTLKRVKSKYECSSCLGRFPATLLDVDRLCFPTVGIRGSGKTHWILQFFKQMRNTNRQTRSTIRWVQSGSDVEKQFDLMLASLDRGEALAGTSHEEDRIPEPVLFSLHDSDRIRPRNELNMLIFDLSGEVMKDSIDMHKLKLRAMKMDGFLLFLDPCQVIATEKTLNMEEQLAGVHTQCREMKEVRGLGDNDLLRVPVAVCVSKLDLIPKHNPLGGAGHEFLEKLRKTEHKKLTLELIQERSNITADYIREMFLGWDVEQTLKDDFGERYMFFPLTPVNMIKEEIGIEDLKKRSKKPFDIQEPILWLLHLHGYCVFD